MATRRETITITVRMDGVRETLAAFNRLDREANVQLRKETKEIAEDLAAAQRRAAIGDGAQSVLMVPTVKARMDRVITVVAGGGKRVGRYRKPAGALIFASEFGMNRRSGWYAAARFAGSRGRQYHPHTGRVGYWFFPASRRMEDEMYRRWFAVCDRLLAQWGAGGSGRMAA
jgi:hypothetical protein